MKREEPARVQVLRRLDRLQGGLRAATGPVAAARACDVMTPDLLHMQAHLFDCDTSQVAGVSDAALGKVLSRLRTATVLDPFRLWLVGSRLEPGREQADIDLVLSPHTAEEVSDEMVEGALWHCRDFGLHGIREPGAKPGCLIDPCYRCGGPAVEKVALEPGTVLQTSKLFSPKLAKLTAEGRIEQYRRFGRFSIEYLRKAAETDYYAKLPRCSDTGASYLRPAVEIT